jgi:hypothetical protein
VSTAPASRWAPPKAETIALAFSGFPGGDGSLKAAVQRALRAPALALAVDGPVGSGKTEASVRAACALLDEADPTACAWIATASWAEWRMLEKAFSDSIGADRVQRLGRLHLMRPQDIDRKLDEATEKAAILVVCAGEWMTLAAWGKWSQKLEASARPAKAIVMLDAGSDAELRAHLLVEQEKALAVVERDALAAATAAAGATRQRTEPMAQPGSADAKETAPESPEARVVPARRI